MKHKQRGVIATVWLYVAGVALLLLLFTGAVEAWKSYTNGLDQKGFDRGVAETDAAYKKRDNSAMQSALLKLKTAEEMARALEIKIRDLQVNASTKYQQGVRDGQKQTDARVAAVRDGSLRLSIPGDSARSSANNCAGNEKSGVAAAAGGSDGQTGTQLPTAASEFLLTLTGEADQVTKQLALCQDVVSSDRSTP